MHLLRYKAGRLTNMRIWLFTANLMKACENYSQYLITTLATLAAIQSILY